MSRKAREASAMGAYFSYVTERKTEAQHSGSRLWTAYKKALFFISR